MDVERDILHLEKRNNKSLLHVVRRRTEGDGRHGTHVRKKRKRPQRKKRNHIAHHQLQHEELWPEALEVHACRPDGFGRSACVSQG